MYGAIGKRYLTQSILSLDNGAKEVYVNTDFGWEDITTTFYVLCDALFSPAKVQTQLSNIWGVGNCTLRVSTSFDSLVFMGKKLIYSGGKWVDV